MNDDRGEKEPSMEEILSSIRKIISEDTNDGSEGGGAMGAPAVGTESVPGQEHERKHEEEPLELLDEVEEDTLELVDRFKEEPLVLRDEVIDSAHKSESIVLPPMELEPVEEQSLATPNTLVSPEVEAVSTAALSQLTKSLAGHDVPLGRADQTLEQVVKELVRPMLREWLDDNLPTVVEELVRREIQRIVKVAETPD